jgi:hypothetical protein
MPMEEMRTFFTGIAVVVSFWSLWWSWRGWRESNRPIVTVHVESVDETVGPIRYNLVVTNSGNRPAMNVRLSVDPEDIEKCLEDDALHSGQSKIVAHVKRCFSGDATIALLIPNSRTTSSFGYSGDTEQGPFWKYRSRFSWTSRMSTSNITTINIASWLKFATLVPSVAACGVNVYPNLCVM